ncbi:MAG: glycosyltransferase family 39 protein [Acidobacteria bacterium]|nr:glycosyltransferase family 39 protein [Acidobacteriota bacterium]
MHTATSDRTGSRTHIGLLVAIAFLSRLPQLTSPHLLLDGDEAVLGLMARHLLAGGALPVFFDGQTYGLSTVEVAAGAAAFAVAGTGAIPLKLAMLALWTAGIIFHYLALARLIGRRAALFTTMLLVLLPAWMVWSMKARGGYLTAFAAVGALFYVLVRLHERPRAWLWLSAGMLTGITFLSQRLWLPAMAPIVAAAMWTHRRISCLLIYLAGVTAVLLSASGATGLSAGALFESPRPRNSELLASLPALVARIETNLTGSYYLWTTSRPGAVTALLARVWYAVLIALLLVQIYRVFRRQPLPWSHLLCVSVLATLAASWIMLSAPDARFLLPLGALLVMWLGIEAADLAPRAAAARVLGAGAFSILLGLGVWSSVEFRDYAYLWGDAPSDGRDETARITRLIDDIKAQGIRHVFSTNGLLQWQLMFYSDETLIARAAAEVDRYPHYVEEVDRALDDGLPIAVVGYTHTMRGIDDWAAPDTIVRIDDKYWLYTGADKNLLRGIGFYFLSDRPR